jgi:predicted branched-subunit amino acid permease
MAEDKDLRRTDEPTPLPPAPASPWAAFARGLGAVVSVPAAVLFATALGVGALARDGGFTIGHAAFLSVTMFALPNQVVLIDQLARNETIAAAALAVTLTAVRLLPMTVTFIPLLRSGRRRRGLETLAAHFIAITTWIEANRRLPSLAPEVRLAYHLGLGIAITSMMLAGTLSGYGLAGRVPPQVTAALLFTTPLYFVLSLIATSRARMDLAAIAIGCALSPVFYLAVPGFDLLATGLIGGTLAYLLGRGAGVRPLGWAAAKISQRGGKGSDRQGGA